MRKWLAAALVILAPSVFPALALAGPECRCIYQGRYFDQGETVCIRVDGRTRFARCEMALNNSSWTFLAAGCPSAAMTPLPRPLSAIAAGNS